MARDFSRAFYKSAAWKKTRAAYWKAAGGLCEDCRRAGIITQGEEVHHIVELTPENIRDPAVALAWSNLVLLCHRCHMKRHNPGARRYKIDPATGRVSIE